jgi:hypothetical protein
VISRVFWILFALESSATLLISVFLHSQGGPFRGWAFVALIPLVPFAIAAAVFFFTGSSSWVGIACTIVLVLSGVPSAFFVCVTAYRFYEARQLERGDAYFSGAARRLAHALSDRDVARVKELIPAAGDLNTPHGGGWTLLQFGIAHADDKDPSVEMVRALLAAGGDLKSSRNAGSLYRALSAGPRLSKLLLDAGANPNLLDAARRPVWWSAIAEWNEDLTLLRLLLDHGADVHSRDSIAGPVSWAVQEKCWRAVCLLVERGAGWKEEMRNGQTVRSMLAAEIRDREFLHTPVPDELRKALAFYDAGPK